MSGGRDWDAQRDNQPINIRYIKNNVRTADSNPIRSIVFIQLFPANWLDN